MDNSTYAGALRFYLQPFRIPFLIGLASVAIFVLPDQMAEFYLITRDDVDALISFISQHGFYGLLTTPARLSQLAILYISFFAFVTITAVCAAGLVNGSRIASDKALPGTLPFPTRLLVVVVALVPLAGIAYGYWSATSKLAGSLLISPDHTPSSDYWIYAAWSSVVVLQLLIWLSPVPRVSAGIFKPKTIIFLASLVAAVTAIFYAASAEVAQYIGTFALLCTFFSALVYFASAARLIYVKFGIPLISILILSAFAWAQLGLNDNHRVEHAFEAGSPPKLEQSFIDWAKARADKAYYAEKNLPYPVYFVSAEGGDIYAGLHAANFLAAMQDQCSNFAQHVFAASSVSGGSLGTATFAGLASKLAKNDQWQGCRDPEAGTFTHAVQQFFSTDFLAPLAAAALFPDFMQRFIPYPLFKFDRAKALERSFLLAWSRTGLSPSDNDTKGPFEQPLSALWAPHGATPALIVNTTSVSTGSRISISPIGFEQTPTAMHISWALTCDAARNRNVSMSLATAVSLSARFPWLTPVGRLERSEEERERIRDYGPVQGSLPAFNGRTVVAQLAPAANEIAQVDALPFDPSGDARRIAQGENRPACSDASPDYGKRLALADGGYYENSGLETLLEIESRIRRVAAVDEELRRVFPFGLQIRTIVIFARDEFANRWWSQEGVLSRVNPSEFLAPTDTLLNTRRARARAVHTRKQLYDDAFFLPESQYFKSANISRDAVPETAFENKEVYNVMLDGKAVLLPLGWHLSKSALSRIQSTKSQETRRSTRLIRRDLMGGDDRDVSAK
jgi:hypothetical protein